MKCDAVMRERRDVGIKVGGVKSDAQEWRKQHRKLGGNHLPNRYQEVVKIAIGRRGIDRLTDRSLKSCCVEEEEESCEAAERQAEF